ncbi:hypothetical protein [Umezawaea sp. Da 62-37]|uniref:hypothetical protein n=1 Tax=Umezawaea sp. Da 62-37 TaxID=3075927 RepID=UPI0028F70893|nr:hypothetical protein [Umezawaea sp. Da 62-37]WNV87962.1 hypothetical protein RM788_06650 [Umezawaea sp. Da 62-37]
MLVGSGFDDVDLRRIDTADTRARSWSGPGLGRAVLPPGADDEAVALVERHCVFSHAGLLLFPSSVSAALNELRRKGMEAAAPERGRFVRRRLADRYRLAESDLDVVRVRTRDLGLHLLPRTCRTLTEGAVVMERSRAFESHLAVRLRTCDVVVVEGLLHLFAHEGLWFEGGACADGRTEMYFAAPGGEGGLPHRVELVCAGEHRSLLRRHGVDVELVSTAYRGVVAGR